MYRPTRMPRRHSIRFLAAFLFTSLAILWVAEPAPAQKSAPEKRPVTHNDYDIWNSIQAPQIAPNGSFLCYSLTYGKGGSVLVVRNIATDKEFRFGPGMKGDPAKKVGPPQGTAGKATFTADSQKLIFTISPKGPGKKDEQKKEEQKKDKEPEKGAEPVRTSMGIMDLATGEVKEIPGVRTFALPDEPASGGIVVYHRLPPPGVAPDKKGGLADDVDDDDDDSVNSDGIWFDGINFVQKGKKGGGGGGAPQKQAGKGGPTAAVGSDLVVRRLADGAEEFIPDVTEFLMTRDGRILVCVIAGKAQDGASGVYAFATGGPIGKLQKLALAEGKARYTRFTWDENQKHLAFFADRGANPKEPDIRVMFWDGNGDNNGPAAVEVLNLKTAKGLKPGYTLVERGGVSLSDDGTRLHLAAALPTPPEEKGMGGGAKGEKALVELWHWKDEFIQPMMKIRGPQDSQRTFSTVFHIKDKQLIQLADKTLPSMNLLRGGSVAIGTDDTPYRPLVAYDGNYSDVFLVNTTNGSRKPLLKKHRAGVSASPSGKYGIYFDGKDWNTLTLAEGSVTNITKNIKTNFYSEDHDSPSAAPSYGLAGWSSDEYFVLIYDKYDIWEVSVKGNAFRNLTGSAKRGKATQYRHVRLDTKEKGIDMNAPLFMRTVNLKNRDEGFAALDSRGNSGPKQLIEQPCSFGTPTKAKYSNLMLLTAQTYYKYPDLYVARADFSESIRVTDANPQQADFIWGQAQLIQYKNADGVPLSGFLIRPEHFDSTKKYPLMVYIYEKLSQNMHKFVLPKEGTSINPTYYASNGYMVLMPDIVYTVGYPGQSAMKCVLPAIQAVVDRGNVDEDAIGIQGHSWGGYQIAYMVTQTNRFKAAAAGAPVANMVSAYDGIRWGTGLPRQFQYEKTQSRIGGTLWEYPMRFVENSPIFMADRVNTPLMMLHNDQDDAVPWYQGIEYYLALRRLGKEVYMFNYIGEKHGLGKKANKMDYTMRMQQFFDHNLRGKAKPDWMVKGLPYVPKAATKDLPAGKGEPGIGGVEPGIGGGGG